MGTDIICDNTVDQRGICDNCLAPIFVVTDGLRDVWAHERTGEPDCPHDVSPAGAKAAPKVRL